MEQRVTRAIIVMGIILIIIAAYLAVGFLFAIPFVLKGVDRIDEGAHGAGWAFRLIIIPGIMVFWPLLLRKWIHISKHTSNDETTP
jgi:hypothetical protein